MKLEEKLRSDFMTESLRLGATVVYEDGHNKKRIIVKAPDSMVWVCSHSHELVFELNVDDKEDACISALKDVLQCMSVGVVRCEEPDCESCEREAI